jgi:hypothetical protein
MSEYYSAYAVKGNVEKVESLVKTFFSTNNVSLNPIPTVNEIGQQNSLLLGSSGDWSFIAISDNFTMPAFAEYLSKELGTVVLNASYEATTGANHISIIENGYLKSIFTYLDDEWESFGFDFEKWFEKAQGSTEFVLQPGSDIFDIKYGAANAFSVFNEYCPHFVEKALDLYVNIGENIKIFTFDNLPAKEIGFRNIFEWEKLK